jgi:hypothetical protein
MCGRNDRLQKVPLLDGSFPTGEFPETLAQLLVAGNERLPDGTPNSWNATKSRILLLQYDPDTESDGEELQELSGRSRDRRLRLARAIGVTQSQLNFGQLAL